MCLPNFSLNCLMGSCDFSNGFIPEVSFVVLSVVYLIFYDLGSTLRLCFAHVGAMLGKTGVPGLQKSAPGDSFSIEWLHDRFWNRFGSHFGHMLGSVWTYLRSQMSMCS